MQIGGEPLDLQLTLMDSAQCFVWKKRGERFVSVREDGPVWLWRSEAGIEAQGAVSTASLRHYLDLDRDYGDVARACSRFPAARRAMALYPGLRVLNQPPWEALVCFILSSNNNVPRIRSLVDALCRHLGREWRCGGDTLYGFPTPDRLAACGEDELRALKVGYRARYLIGAARAVEDGFPLDGLRGMPFDEARSLLVSLPGVGEKVADCVLLFGCGHAEAFPVDVWVERLLREWFGMTCASRAELARQARDLFGDRAGLMQQCLFHAARTGALGEMEAGRL